MNSFAFKDLTIRHTAKRGMKNSYISITSEAEIVLKTPKVTQSFIVSLLQERESWIRKKLIEAKKNKAIEINIEDEVLLFGTVYSIDTPEASKLRVKLEKIKARSKEKVIKCYNLFYKEYSLEYITPRVEYFAKIMNYDYKEIKYRKMKSRWGSCNSKKVLTFNTELMKIKKELIDYVVVHELSHLKHMNHSREFHALVDKYFPNSKKYRAELKKIKIATF